MLIHSRAPPALRTTLVQPTPNLPAPSSAHRTANVNPRAVKMGSVFDEYDKEVGSLLVSVSRELAGSVGLSGSKKLGLEAAERLLLEAGEVVESMGLEAATAPSARRSECRMRISARQAELARLRRELRDVAAADDRGQLLGDDALSERAHMVDSTRSLRRGTDLIANSHRNAAATAAIGAAILEDLHNQRGTIMRARDTVIDIDGGLGQSQSIISSMNRRAALNRVAIYAVFAAVGLSVVAVLYFRVHK